MSRDTGVESARFGRIVCDDELEDELVTKIEAWVLEYQAEIERQRGWTAQSLEAPASVIPVALLERQPEDALPCIAVRVERTSAVATPQSRETAMDWRLVVEVFAGGADDVDVRSRVRAHVAAVRALLMHHAPSGPLITNAKLVGTEYAPSIDAAGRTFGAGSIEFVVSTENVTKRYTGNRTPGVDPYEAPAGLVEVVDTNATIGTDLT